MATSDKSPLGPVQQWMTHALLENRFPAAVAEWVRAKIAGSPEWQAEYDAIRQAERVASGAALSGSQLDLLEGRILAAANTPPPRARWPVAFALGAASAAAVAFAVLPTSGPGAGEEWHTRGGHAEGALGLKVRCLRAGEARAEVMSEAVLSPGTPGHGLRCPRGDLLAFSVTNLQPEARHLMLVGITPDGDLRWYAPFDADGAGVTVRAGDVDRLLDTVADTSGMPADERVTLFAVFSERPIEASAIADELSSARGRGLALGRLDRLPVDLPQGRADLSFLAK